MESTAHDYMSSKAPTLVDLMHLFNQLAIGMHYLTETQLKGMLERSAHLLEMVSFYR